ncbi:MAG: hypothetical protein AB9903_18855 [Vulcanimicrobiota bacterium]
MIGIVVTTVNPKCEELLKPYIDIVGKRDDAVLYIVGDVQYDPSIKSRNVECLSFAMQKEFTGGAAFIPERTGSRRFVGFLKAVADGCRYILAIDDDNYPVDNSTYIDSFLALMEKERSVTCQPHQWVNMLEEAYSPPRVYPRGYTLTAREKLNFQRIEGGEKVIIKVVAGLWGGDPDVDAVERIARDPERLYDLKDGYSEIKSPDSYCPFDTQNTLIASELLPALYLEHDIARYDDIWMSYLCQVVMKHHRWAVHYGIPYVYQERNPHNFLRDLKDELFGMEHTDEFIRTLEEAEQSRDIKEHTLNISKKLVSHPLFRIYGENLQQWLKLIEAKGV